MKNEDHGDHYHEGAELPDWLIEQLEKRAAAERDAGTTIEIHDRLGYVAIDRTDGQEWFFQGQEAAELLAEVPDNIYASDYILALSQNW